MLIPPDPKRSAVYEAGQGRVRQGKARRMGRPAAQPKGNKAVKGRQGRAGQGGARQGKARQGKARQGKARQGKARQGKARQGKAKQGRVRQTFSALSRLSARPKKFRAA